MGLEGIYWTILLLGGLQGFILGILIIFAHKGHTPTRKYLTLLLFLSAYTLLVEMLRSSLVTYQHWAYYFLIDLHWVYGPLLYCMARSFLDPAFRIHGRRWIIFLPFGLQIGFHIWVKIQNIFWAGSPTDLPWMGSESYQLWMHTPFPFLILFGLMFVAIGALQQPLKKAYARALNDHQKEGLHWLNRILWVFMLFSLLGMILIMLDFVFFDYAFAPFYPYPVFIGMAIMTYALAISGYAKREATLPPISPPIDKQATQTIHPRAATLEQLNQYFADHHPYLDPEMTLIKLAALMETKGYLLTQALNQIQGQTFSQYLNSFRVAEAKRLLHHPEFDHLTLLAVGFEAGFNSKASFNRVFKAATGMPPGTFRKNKAN